MREKPAFGRATEAMSGLAHLSGFPDGPPMHPGFPAADSTTGLMGALGIMLALFAREKGAARGQVVDLAVFEALLRLIEYPVPALTGAKISPQRNGLRQPMDFAPGGMFRTADGIWVTVSAGSAETAQRLLRAVGGDALANDPRFATLNLMSQHMAEVFDALNDFITQRSLAEVEEVFARHDAVAARVLSIEEIVEHPQINHRGDIVAIEGDDTRVIGPVPHLSDTPGALRWLGRPPGWGPEPRASSRTKDSSSTCCLYCIMMSLLWIVGGLDRLHNNFSLQQQQDRLVPKQQHEQGASSP